MNIKFRLFIAFFLVFGAGLYYVFDIIVNDIRPRYFETVEESMNDTAHILAALIEEDITGGKISVKRISELSDITYQKKFSAKIYSHLKTNVDLQFYVCDRNGIVLFDSRNGERTGRDFSNWNDVYLTLRGEYGVRSSKITTEEEGLLYVAAPIKSNGIIIGSVTVEKSKKSVSSFIYLARKRVMFLGFISFAAFTVISIILSFWITSPIKKLTAFINSLKENRHSLPPKFSGSEINDLALAFEKVFKELKGKKYIENYVNALTHEIKSPLSSIRSAAELLTEKLSEEQKEKFAANILRESSRIHSLIEKMLLLSALENREGLKSVEGIKAMDVIEDVTQSLLPQAESSGVELKINCDENIIIEGEYFLVRHSLLNIADNAVKHSSAGSVVEINCEVKNDNAVILVIDQGSGIPDYALQKIFDKFYSIPSASTSKKGTGLGLSFVKESVQLHGGNISITNNSEKGVTAEISFPLKQNRTKGQLIINNEQ